jgi:hypothetical protein
MDKLAEFVDDVKIFIVDSREGVLNWTLGSLIRNYNEICNTDCQFMVNRYTEGDTSILIHNIAGLLGVYGNIASSTALHGLHACQICGDTGSCKCVGDDVYGAVVLDKEYSETTVLESIEALGSIAREKVRWWSYQSLEKEEEDDRSWPYVKRPFSRLENRMTLSPALFLPIFGLINPLPDIVCRQEESLYTRVKLLCVQTMALIRRVHAIFPPLESHQKLLLRQYLRTLYIATGTPQEGRLPFEDWSSGTERFSGLFVPSIQEGFLDCDPWDIIEDRWNQRSGIVANIPKMTDERNSDLARLIADKSLEECTLSRPISYLVKMGWAIAEPLREDRYLDYFEYRRFYESLFAGDLYQLYDVVLTSTCPNWIDDLLYV